MGEQILGDDEQAQDDDEYQRFLSSLLPHDQENLSFLDEEDEEYHPEEEDDDDEDEDTVKATDPRDRVAAKISKKELTELLWDSTRLGLPLLGSQRSSVDALAAVAGVVNGTAHGPPSVTEPVSRFFQPSVRPAAAPTAAFYRRPVDGSRQTLVGSTQELNGAIAQEQCIRLASQMHKHFQLLLQTFHMVASGERASDCNSDDDSDDEAKPRLPNLEAMRECERMLEELQARGEQAQQCKGALLAKLTEPPEDASGASRRVTRSLTAAHAAVSHPSMFEVVGAQAVSELTRKLAERCSLADRDQSVQEHLLEVDTHLLGTMKKNPKKPFTAVEDNLLAHGVKRFALHPHRWEQIEKHFLPGKSPAVIQRRYRYLASSKTGTSAVKEYHARFLKRRNPTWILEEDLRIARGMIEFHDAPYRFARVRTHFLPHRDRPEIGKRWKRICAKWFHAIAAENPSIDTSSIDFAVLVKDLLEDKLREQVKQQSLELMLEHDMDESDDSDSAAENDDDDDASAASKRQPSRPLLGSASASECASKHLHPALFFTSWALVSPASLLSKTCEHNLPSFIGEMAARRPNQATEAAAEDAVGRESSGVETDSSAVSVECVLEGVATDVGTRQDIDTEGIASTISSEDAFWAEEILSSTAPLPPSPSPPPPSLVGSVESEPSTANTSAVLDDEEDDDSDYEHDELVSSDGEHGSDSEEFEQLELSDDEEDDESDFDYEELGVSDDSGGDCDDDESAEDESDAVGTPSRGHVSDTGAWSSPIYSRIAKSAVAIDQTVRQHQLQQRPVRYTLRLRNLLNPEDERTKRALEALERRIVGKSLKDVLVKPPAARPASKRRIVSRVLSDSAQQGPDTDGSDKSDAFLQCASPAKAVGEAGASALVAVDLATDEVLSSPSGGDDDDFECEELLDNDSANDSEVCVPITSTAPAPLEQQLQQQDQQYEPWQPNKKVKLRHSATCSTCRSVDMCSCARQREQQLLRRLQRRASERQTPSTSRANSSS